MDGGLRENLLWVGDRVIIGVGKKEGEGGIMKLRVLLGVFFKWYGHIP